MLGGLLSAHYLAGRLPDMASKGDSIYLTKAADLADRLLSAYESPSGIPYASVHLGRKVGLPSHADGGSSSMAEAATLQLEMKYLSHITGDERYWRRAEKVMQVLDDNAMEAGLLPIFVHPDTGRFTTAEIRLGSRGDSYYGQPFRFPIPPPSPTPFSHSLLTNTAAHQNTSSNDTSKPPTPNPSTSACGKKPSPASKHT
jgi:mannosyl-oligosaccharide alpha-1,2-mannosidase